MQNPSYLDRFRTYFQREVSKKAAKSLSDRAEIEFRVLNPLGTEVNEIFYLTKVRGENQVNSGPAPSAQIEFTLTEKAAEKILGNSADEVASIGIEILKLILSEKPDEKVNFRLKASVLSFISKGYLGVLTAGGSGVATFLASKGINGIGAIQSALKKMKT